MSDTFVFWLGLALGALVTGVSVAVVAYRRHVKLMEDESVARGYAEWCVDNTTGKTTFKWKENK